jgi:hypothetical protein
VRQRNGGLAKNMCDRTEQRHYCGLLGYSLNKEYGELALQVGGASNEAVKYGREFFGTWTRE